MMKYLIVLMLLISMVYLPACSIKYGDKELNVMQMQTRKGSASIYTTKVFGVKFLFPLSNLGVFELLLGYGGETKGLIPTKEDGELPNSCIDITNTIDKSIFSDTFSTGEVSKQLYPLDNSKVNNKGK